MIGSWCQKNRFPKAFSQYATGRLSKSLSLQVYEFTTRYGPASEAYSFPLDYIANFHSVELKDAAAVTKYMYLRLDILLGVDVRKIRTISYNDLS